MPLLLSMVMLVGWVVDSVGEKQIYNGMKTGNQPQRYDIKRVLTFYSVYATIVKSSSALSLSTAEASSKKQDEQKARTRAIFC